MVRHCIAFLVGGFAGGLFNMALVMVSQAMYPLPEGLDPNDFEAFQAHVEVVGLPTGAMMIVLLAHAGGSLVSGLVCGLIARRACYLPAALLGILWTCGGIAMLVLLPAPTWFAVADVVLYVPSALLGVTWGGALMAGRPEKVASA